MLIGFVFLLVSFIPWLFRLHPSLEISGLFAISWGVGYLSICKAIQLKRAKRGTKILFAIPKAHIFVIGFIFAFLIELFGNWIWKMWYYPPFSIDTYLIAMPFIIAIYFYFLLQGYLSARALLMPFRKKIKNRKSEEIWLVWAGRFGGFGIIVGIMQALSMVHYQDIHFFNSYGVQKFNLTNVIIVSFSVFFILEYLEYRQKEDTFLSHILHGDWVPLASVMVASISTSLSMEAMNIPMKIWAYTNWPGPHIQALDGLPPAIFLVWPVQYIIMIAFYRVFYKRETVGIWD